MNNSDFEKEIQNITKELADGFKKLSDAFAAKDYSQAEKNMSALFRSYLVATQNISSVIKQSIETINSLQTSIAAISDEKRKMKTLYCAGIKLTSIKDIKLLTETALDIVVKELKADTGFITLVDQSGALASIYSINSSVHEKPEAVEISQSVINQTIKTSQPYQLEREEIIQKISAETSIIRLGISAVICVPLISAKRTLGAVYIDRRNQENSFANNDLKFLLSFAQQIVKAIEISSDFSEMEKNYIEQATIDLSSLRNEFACEEIIGNSKKLFDALKVASRLAQSDVSIIISGESGTGKNQLAKAIHKNSARRDKPFYTVDCSSIPTDLLESELFGYESGAFTGAAKMKIGKFELANGGTLFLDEIGEMNINLQPKLLRVIQTKEFERLGGVNSIKLDVRIITATNRNLQELISKGKFREDLYFRLKVIELKVPSLCERTEDIPPLAEYFLEKHAISNQKKSISDAAMDILLDYSWPGNIRELENVLLHCVVLSKGDMIGVEDLPPELIVGSNFSDDDSESEATLAEAEEKFRRRIILRAIQKSKTKADAAKILGVNRTHFYKMLAQLGIE